MSLLVILLLPMVGAAIGYIIGKKSEYYRDVFNVVMTGLELLLVTLLYKEVSMGVIELFIPDVMGIGLYLKLDMLRYVFVWLSAFIWFLSTMYSTQYIVKYKNRNRYYAYFMLTLSSSVGIFLSENILNLFTFFEIMSFTSYALVIHDEDEYAHEGGRIYLAMAIAGGLVTLMGLFLLYDYTATLNIEELAPLMTNLGNIKYVISFLIIFGFAVKASLFPLHVWLPKAYPAAPTPANAILSGVLLKAGIFGVMVTSLFIMDGDIIISTIILVLGLINMIFGGFLAIFQRNIKRILAYSSMSQAGYIFLGVGLIGLLKGHNLTAIYATIYHIINHALFKVLLFLAAGLIYMIIRDLSINVIKGFGKHKLLLKVLFLIGAFAIAGMPGFNGYISKTLLHHALSEAHHIYHSELFIVAEIIFNISSGLTVAYMTKIFIAVFIEKNEKYKGQYKSHMSKRALFPLIILSGLIIYIGLRPNIIINVIDKIVESFNIKGHLHVDFYTFHNLKSSFTTIIIGLGIYVLFIRRYLVNTKEGKRVYKNPSIGWFSLEDDFYIPVIKFTFKYSSKIFHIIDKGIIDTVKYVNNKVKKLGNINIGCIKRKIIPIGIKDIKIKDIKMKDKSINKDIDFKYNLSDIIEKLRSNMNSLMYSVFIFAIMLLLALTILVL
ncbi:MAG: hypothetical protein FH753_05155 [Firmicutes bacterium]|nr:hypothetical protein [Bacillota bacterium]